MSIIEKALDKLDDDRPKAAKVRAAVQARETAPQAEFDVAFGDLPPLGGALEPLDEEIHRGASAASAQTAASPSVAESPTLAASTGGARDPVARTHNDPIPIGLSAAPPTPAELAVAAETAALPSDGNELSVQAGQSCVVPVAPHSEARGYQSAATPPEARNSSREINLDLGHLRAVGMLTPESDQTLLAEQYRAIKRPLLLQAAMEGADRRPNANLIMIASALPNEGKTSTAINLAISIAQERDRTVLLVDADVAKSDISNNLGIAVELGLTDLLHDPTLSVPDVMLRTNIEKLTLIPAGKRHTNVTELFSGSDMARLMSEMSSRYPERIIIIDSPPLLAASGASVLASLAGQILLVIEAVRTPQRAVKEALRMLGPLDNIGIVLNKVRQGGSEYEYGYGYGYGYDRKD
ncbi:MAG: protein-tyrosine kinase [Gammaproteobacteria bacterium]